MKGVKKLEKSRDVWDILQNTNMTENFELSSDDEDANETVGNFLLIFKSFRNTKVQGQTQLYE